MKLEYSIEGHIGRLTLAGTPYNALTTPLFTSREKLEAFLASPELRAVIVQGEGRHFCAGADLSALAEQVRRDDFADMLDQGKALLETLSMATIPVMALISGSCLGAGMEIALACHFRYASNNAMLGFPETNLGLMPGFGGTINATSTVPRGRAMQLLLSGRMVRGQDAMEIGLVHGCAPQRKLESAAQAFLDSIIGAKPPYLIRAVMTSIHNAKTMPRKKALAEETSLFCRLAGRLDEASGSQDE